MQTAPIPEDRSTAHVTQGILETELHALTYRSVLFKQITATMMQIAPTPKGHFTARVIRDIPEMVSPVMISMNATHLDCHLIINIWPTNVMVMLTVQTLRAHTTVAVKRVTMEVEKTAKISMNAHLEHTIAMWMPTAATQKVHFIALVMRDTQEMELLALISASVSWIPCQAIMSSSIPTTAMVMLTALILRDRSTAPVTMATLEMESFVLI